jgi:sugar lactone lactonase YvrE
LALATSYAARSSAHPIHLPNVALVQLVADGVDNPRGLAFDASGNLHIAAAGRGGMDACTTNEQGLFCNGLTAAVLKVAASDLRNVSAIPAPARPIAQRIISMAYPGGAMAHGLHGVATIGNDVYVAFMGPELIGWGGSEHCCQNAVQGALRRAALAQIGNLMRITPTGGLEAIADVDHFEYTYNPVATPGSNPYAMAVDTRDPVTGRPLAGGQRPSFLVADAGGNTLLRVTLDGQVSLVAAFDNIRPGDENTGVEAVPTGVAVGPDGNYYVSLLAGFHPGFARIVQVTRTGVQRIVADGLSMLNGIAVAPGGTIYAPEYSNADIVRVRPDPESAGTWLAPEIINRGAVVTPTAIAVGPDGWVYVSDGGTQPADTPFVNGKIVRFRG